MKTTITNEIKRLFLAIKKGNTPYVICIKCGRGGMQSEGHGWQCLWRDCRYSTDSIPSLNKVEQLVQLAKDFKQIKKLGL